MSNTIRAKVFYVSHRTLLCILNSHRYKDGDPLVITVSQPLNLPKDSYIRHVGYSMARQGYEVLIESQSFPEVLLDGREIPIHDELTMEVKAYHVISESSIRSEQSLKSLTPGELNAMRLAIDEELYDRGRGK